MPQLLDQQAITARLSDRPGWELRGGEISRVFKLGTFADAIQFVNRIASIAEKAGHHPDIDIRWNKVTLRLSTHSKGGLTELDFELARQADSVAA